MTDEPVELLGGDEYGQLIDMLNSMGFTDEQAEEGVTIRVPIKETGEIVEFTAYRFKVPLMRCSKCGKPTRLHHLHDGGIYGGPVIDE